MSGAAIGLIGGPPAALGGAAAGVAISAGLKRVGSEISQRLLTDREETRIGAAYATAILGVAARTASGQQPRTDGFFNQRGDARSESDELLEGVLLKARDAYEEKKAKLLGNIYSSTAFSDEVSIAAANHALVLADSLTYRQIVLLAVFADGGRRNELRDAPFGDGDSLNRLGIDGRAMLSETYDLYGRGLIGANNTFWLSITDVYPRNARTHGQGGLLVSLIGPENIPIEDKELIYAKFGSD